MSARAIGAVIVCACLATSACSGPRSIEQSGDASLDGESGGGSNPCGGIDLPPCPEGMWCSQPEGGCLVPYSIGVCKVRMPACPTASAKDVVCGCDGLEYASACRAHAEGQSVAYVGVCKGLPPIRICGGSTGAACPSGEYCDYGDGSCPTGGVSGKCAQKPLGCPDVLAPVCGCNGQTYRNICDAHQNGVTIDTIGECGKPKVCGGLMGLTCASTEYCDFGLVPSACGRDDGTGVCKPRPTSCVPSDGVWCGCDGQTYESRCAAARAGSGVRKNKPC